MVLLGNVLGSDGTDLHGDDVGEGLGGGRPEVKGYRAGLKGLV